MRRNLFLISLVGSISFFEINAVVHAGAVTSDENISISTTGGGVKIKSDNGNSFQFGGFIQYDYDNYDGAYNAGNNGDSGSESEWRRTRLTAKGTRGKDWVYDFTIDINDDDEEASVDAASIRYKGFNNLELILGRLKAPFSLEELTSDKWVSTIERSAIFGLGNFLSGKPDFQVAAHGHWNKLTAQLQLIDEGEEDDDDSDTYSVAGRLTNLFLIGDQDIKDHYAHVGGSYALRDFGNNGSAFDFRSRFGVHTIEDRPTAGNDVVVKDAYQFGLEGLYVIGPFSLQSEYVMGEFDGEDGDPAGADVDADGVYLLATYTLTGEPRQFKASSSKLDKIKPSHPYGAWELVAKYEDGEVAIDNNPNGDAEYDIMTLGINWYPNTNLRFSMNYLMTDTENFQFGDGGGGLTNPRLDALDEEDGDALSLRAQYVF